MDSSTKMSAFQAIDAWNFFIFNFNAIGDVKDVLVKVFGQSLGMHFYGKFQYFYEKRSPDAAIVNLYIEMTDGNRRKWLDYIVDNYSQFKSEKYITIPDYEDED